VAVRGIPLKGSNQSCPGGLRRQARPALGGAAAWRVAAFPESYIDSGYEQHCLGTPNSGRSHACRAHASRTCPRSGMSPSVGSILGEQGQQPADQCRLYARQHRTGAYSTWRNSVFDPDTRGPIALIELLFAAEGQTNRNLLLRGKSQMLNFVKTGQALRKAK